MAIRSSLPPAEATSLNDQAFAEATAAVTNAVVEPDDAWRLTVLKELETLASIIGDEYRKARKRQTKSAWEARIAPVATGGSAAVGAVLAVVGSANTSGTIRWAIVVLGVAFAFGGSILGANTYVRNRSLTLRHLRLLHDLPDYALLVLPNTTAPEAYTQLDTFRTLWETAGS